MNTTAAAVQAGVTTDTIRTWCRRNVIAATKRAGRWVIDTASLAYRISLGQKAPMSETEHRVDTNTTIRVRPGIFPGARLHYNAVLYRAGRRIDTLADGDTAQAALDSALRVLARTNAATTAAEELEEAGLYSDLTGTHTPGIHQQMQALAPGPVAPGVCHFCGLTKTTCDCR